MRSKTGVCRARVDDALRRQRRAKEQMMQPSVQRPRSARELRQLVGRDAHRAIADEMARFL